MAIRLTPRATDSRLFCCSKWWGNPDLPPGMEFPTMQVSEDGETYDYPLTFICQIDCEDLAPFDKEGKFPRSGMFYFFAAVDEYLGYDSPEHFGLGRWPKKAVLVKYTPSINMETFNSCMLVDDDDKELAEPEMAIEFSECDDSADGIKLFGLPFFEDVRSANPDCVSLLQLDEDETLGMRFYDSGMFNFLIKASDFGFGNWKRAFGYMHSL